MFLLSHQVIHRPPAARKRRRRRVSGSYCPGWLPTCWTRRSFH